MKVPDTPIAACLHKAAFEFLSPGDRTTNTLCRFSCDAAAFAAKGDTFSRTRAFLNDLAQEEISISLYAFSEFRPGIRRQGARFLWLYFASLVAAEEGV